MSRSGFSASLGRRGLSVTVGKRRTYVNTGVPGTGLSVRERLNTTSTPDAQPASVEAQRPVERHGYVLVLLKLYKR
jgi:Protein of unknown function (DUF4236)